MQKIKLSINEPCLKKWEDMATIDCGKYCTSCQKNVIDFSAYEADDLSRFFSNPNNQNVCGRFRSEQLQQKYVYHKIIPMPKYWRVATGLAATLLLAQTFSACSNHMSNETQKNDPNYWNKYHLENTILNDSADIKGQIIDAATGNMFLEKTIRIDAYQEGKNCSNRNGIKSSIQVTPNGFFSIKQDSMSRADYVTIYINLQDKNDEKNEKPFATCIRINKADLQNFHQIAIDTKHEQNIAMMSGQVSCRTVK
jgi:hypothetical protein